MVSLRAIKMDYFFTYQQDSAASGDQRGIESVQSLRTGTQKVIPATKDSDYLKSFEEIQLNPVQTQPKTELVLPIYQKVSANTDWLTILLFGAILIFATIRYSYITYIKHLFTSLVNYPTSLRLLQESNYPSSHAAFRLDAIFYISFSIFVFQAFNVLELAEYSKHILFYALIVGGVLIYFFGKRFLYKAVGTLFETDAETGEYLFNMSNFNRTLGIVLIPVVGLVSFSPLENPKLFVISGIIIILIFQLILLQRGVFILLKKQFSILYLFLYLCTLEFLPLLLIYKVVVVE